MVSLVWFRLDLRLADNPALHAATAHGGPVVPIFIHAPEEEAPWEPGAASRWWLHQSLKALQERLAEIGSHLIIRRGPSVQTLRDLVKETGATAVFWNRRYEPAVIARDQLIKETLRSGKLQVESYSASLLHEPRTIRNQKGKPFRVFTPFWKACLNQPDPLPPVSAPKRLISPSKWPTSLSLADLQLEPRINWASGLHAAWRPGESGAAEQLRNWVKGGFEDYSANRNRPDISGTSRLSPHLHFGEVSARQIWHRLRQFAEKNRWPLVRWRGSQFLTEVGWREFAHHLLYHFPDTPEEPLRAEFKTFPWRTNLQWLKTWQKGRTGFPIVDAGMRELWATGWMHNRVRMIVASFLVKDLLISWREGARWFWDTLVDADLANNTLGWQWTAGCGADAAPFFRVFNPATQGEKFDPDGNYVRRWCAEIAKLPNAFIHQPNKAPAEILCSAQVDCGRTYPEPIVSHAIAREVALEAFARIKARAKP
ncbi:MAG TPA: deoxyribodipyrimidine photo-lyase [Candidatus Limnocylindrales bacterium]|nr:deoxyribodipyrimidine photo-lyase [Candidatus Limnocylindrales bacterium]